MLYRFGEEERTFIVIMMLKTKVTLEVKDSLQEDFLGKLKTERIVTIKGFLDFIFCHLKKNDGVIL